jgi:hypothetical protein
MSESYKKEKSLSSPAVGWTFPNLSQDDDKVVKFGADKRDTESGTDAFSATCDIEVSGDDSSYSSFYSFLKTEKSDTSMRSSLGYTNANTVYKAEVIAIRTNIGNILPLDTVQITLNLGKIML